MEYKVGDMVWINSKSMDAIEDDSGTGGGYRGEPIEVKLIKLTPKRFKISWDRFAKENGEICDDPVIICVKNVFKTWEEASCSK